MGTPGLSQQNTEAHRSVSQDVGNSFSHFSKGKWLRILQDGGEDESNVSCSYLSHIWQMASKQSDMKNADNTENRK